MDIERFLLLADQALIRPAEWEAFDVERATHGLGTHSGTERLDIEHPGWWLPKREYDWITRANALREFALEHHKWPRARMAAEQRLAEWLQTQRKALQTEEGLPEHRVRYLNRVAQGWHAARYFWMLRNHTDPGAIAVWEDIVRPKPHRRPEREG